MKSLFVSLSVVALAITVGATQTGQRPNSSQPKTQAGAVQMPGDNGKVGVPYQLGKKGEELVFTLEKAEFASRFVLSDTMGLPDSGKRLLILTMAVQNPGTADRFFFNQSFSFTVVSPDDENYVCDGGSGNGWTAIHPDRRDRLSLQLKPAQKVRALVAIAIHPKGPVNKLIVQRGKGTPVLRYDLKEKVAPMKGAFAANGGLDMLPIGAALLTQNVDLGPWDIVVEKSSEELLPIGEFVPGKGMKFLVFTVTIKNASMAQYPLHRGLIITKVTDIDGGNLPESQNWVKGSTPEAFSFMTVDPGAQVRVRILYEAGLLTKATVLTFKDQQYSGLSAAVKLEEPKKDPPRLR